MLRSAKAIVAARKNSPTRKALQRLTTFALPLVCTALFAQSPPPLQLAQGPQSIGEVEQLRGAGFAQTQGQPPRIMGRGLALNEGDRLTTADNALAIIKLKDGTKMTLRPGTELVLSQYSYRDNSDTNAMVLQLLRGGLRALTGLISKSSPNAAKIQTSTATIGIRGTDFDARICKPGECATATATPRPSAIAASARVLSQQGQITALDEQGQRRVLSPGASIYPGDVVETAANAAAMLAFRDESKVNLGASTRFRVDDFAFDPADLSSSRYFMSLLRGSLRAITGAIGKSNRQNVRFTSSTATIGIRGTELGMSCTGLCANEPAALGSSPTDSGFSVFTFDGSVLVSLTAPGVGAPAGTAAVQPVPIELVAGRGLVFSGQFNASGEPRVELLTAPPVQLPATPLQGVPIPLGTFSQTAVPDGADGLFVFVREGHIVLSTASKQIDLGKGETAFSDARLDVIRLPSVPSHVVNDVVPLPRAANINIPGLRPPSNADPVCRP